MVLVIAVIVVIGGGPRQQIEIPLKDTKNKGLKMP